MIFDRAWNRGEVYLPAGADAGGLPAVGRKHVATYSGGTSGTAYFIHADWLGTERARTTAQGAAYESCTSLPFGDGLICSGGDPSPMHFTGKQRDAESGLDYFGARYDSSSLGRFITADWSSVPVAVPYATLTNPQSLNLYTYVGNNPVTDVDADGHAKEANQAAPGSDCEGSMECEQQGEQAANGALPQKSHDQANADRRAAIAQTAKADEGDTSMPYTPGHATCNLFVQREIAKAGAPKPELEKADGTMGAPSAAEWAGSKIPGWRFLKPGEAPQPGDVAARKENFVDATGHSGIVVSVSKGGVVTVMAAHQTVVGKDMTFQPALHSPNVFRRYTGDQK